MSASRRGLTAATMTVALVTLIVMGCQPRTETREPVTATTSAVESSATTAPVETGGGAEGGTSGSTAVDKAALTRELDAMQREIDSLELPSDTDMDGAASVLY